MKISGSIYLDYQASAPIDSRVRDAMKPFWTDSFANPHSAQHSLGWNASRVLEAAQARVAELLGADADEIIFTSGATEANNLALVGLARRASGGNRTRILASAIEHKCVIEAGRFAADSIGSELALIPVDREGRVDITTLHDSLDDRVLVVSVMAVNNEIGTIQDIEALSNIIHDAGALFHCDAAQAPCAMDLDRIADFADLISLSGHKMYGPQGIGALYVRRDLQTSIEPIIYGGGQQGGLRSGTVPLALAVGMGKAAELISREKASHERRRIGDLRDRFFEGLNERIGSVVMNGPQSDYRHPGNANIQFPGMDAERILISLQPRVAASTGSACTTGIPEPSYVLKAIGLSSDQADASLRFSIGRFVDQDMVDEAIELIAEAVRKTELVPAAE